MKRFLFFISIFIVLPIFCLASNSVDINTASLVQLDELTGVGPVTAQKIVDARPFSSVNDLERVKGIGPITLQKIKDQGLACVNCSIQQTQSSQSQSSSSQSSSSQVSSNQSSATINYPSNIFINEVLPSPQGSDETDEWIELYNSNSFDVDLSGWKIRDQQGTITTFTIPTGIKILANGFLVFKRPETKIMLNNDSDGLIFLSPDGKLIDSMTFAGATIGQSYNKTFSGWQWSKSLTPGFLNIVATASTVKNTINSLPNIKKSDNSSKVEDAELASLSQAKSLNQDIKVDNPWFLFFTVLSTTIILALLVLFIKLKIHVRT